MSSTLTAASLAVLLCLARSEKPDPEDALLRQVDSLRTQLRIEQNELQQALERRWDTRQRQVETKAENQEKIELLRQDVERLYADVARAREEALLREDALTGEAEVLKRKQREWGSVADAVNEKLLQQRSSLTSGFPLDLDARLARAKALENRHGNPIGGLRVLFEMKRDDIERGSRIAVARRTFVLPPDTPVTAQVLRIGRVAAYAVQPDAAVYALTATGKLGERAFEWYRVAAPDVASTIAERMPVWLESKEIHGTLPLDVLQNRHSQALTAGRNEGPLARIRAWVASGGPVMVPLAGIIIWALIIIVNRTVVYARRRSRSYRFINQAVDVLEMGDTQAAAALAAKDRGVLSRILDECLKHSRWNRGVAEKAIRELLLAEVPLLDRHLDTLAVLAAAAPLLGLLGTVTGMIRLFEAITQYGTGDPKLLAGGISEALVTTEAGLIVAIPLLIIHNFLRNRKNGILADMEMYAVRILNRLWPEK